MRRSARTELRPGPCTSSFVGAAIALAIAAIAVGLAGCGPQVATPPRGPHVGDEPVFVPFPPPAPRPEIIRPVDVPGDGAVWVDGEWEWKGSTWMWQEGRWEVPPRGAYFAWPRVIRQPDGRLAWYRGTWHAPPAPQ